MNVLPEDMKNEVDEYYKDGNGDTNIEELQKIVEESTIDVLTIILNVIIIFIYLQNK